MKIFTKRSICLLSALTLLTISFANVNKVKAAPVETPIKNQITIGGQSGIIAAMRAKTKVKGAENATIKEEILTKNEYCKRLAQYEKITLEKATEIVNSRGMNHLRTQSTDSKGQLSKSLDVHSLSGAWVVYKQVYWTESLASADGASCQVTMGCLATVEGYDSFRYIAAVEGSYVMASGSGSFKWVNGNQAAKILNNGDSIYFTAAGTIEGEVSVQLQGGFEKAGFSVSVGVSQTIIVRKFYTRGKYYYV
jgi:hypothetical protein